MGDLLDWWVTGGDWYDLKQRDRIDELQRANAAAAASARSAQREVAQERQHRVSLETRVSQLERALPALLELEDLRDSLSSLAEYGQVRDHARAVLSHLPQLESDPQPIGDAPTAPQDYWLSPAIAAVQADQRGDQASARVAWDQASGRSSQHTALFRAALALVQGRRLDVGVVEHLVPDSEPVSTAQLVVWQAAARGALGPAARQELITGLATTVTALPEPLDDERRAQPRPDLDTALSAVSAHVALTGASNSLEGLTDWIEAELDGPWPAPEAAPDSSLVAEGRDLLARVVGSGGPAEELIFARVQETRQALDAIGVAAGPRAPQAVDASTVSLFEALTDHLQGADPALRRTAVLALAEPIARRAEEFAAAVARPAEPTREISVRGLGRATVTRAGATSKDWRTPRDAGDALVKEWRTRVYWAAGVSMVCLLLCLSTVWFAIPAVLALGVGIWCWLRSNTERKATLDRVQQAQRDGDATIKAAAADLQEEWVRLQDRARQAPEWITRLRAALARPSAGSDPAPGPDDPVEG